MWRSAKWMATSGTTKKRPIPKSSETVTVTQSAAPLSSVGSSGFASLPLPRFFSGIRQHHRRDIGRNGYAGGGLLFLQADIGGEDERPRAEQQRIPQEDDAAQEGPLHHLRAVDPRSERLLIVEDFPIGRAHGDGHLAPPAHHHALHHRLPAVVKRRHVASVAPDVPSVHDTTRAQGAVAFALDRPSIRAYCVRTIRCERVCEMQQPQRRTNAKRPVDDPPAREVSAIGVRRRSHARAAAMRCPP